ncbi:MAG: methylated-DNA--[protein]-cysteine S-methyltransferase [candidate division Zixibacteria bacterium]|nr:methylated-DNA--[protein]-cysteine S-methyltransferase [candidate division Zixibacteria bacterium]
MMKGTPVGNLFIGGSSKGINAIYLNPKSESASLKEYSKKCESKPEKNNLFFKDAVEQLDGYFKGKLKTFKLKLDLTGTTEFRKKVYGKLRKVKPGKTTSYGELAEKSGGKALSRAVGSAMAGNPIPIVIPCHRVIKSDGGLGGFGGGLPMKEKLLKIEGIEF